MSKEETLSISAVQDAMSILPGVQPFFEIADRGPSWDGYLCVSTSNNGAKNGISRILVQVKGHMESAVGKEKISYSVEVVDLNNYYNNGGCLFFVVYISPNAPLKERTIFYSSLLPYDLRKILTGKKEQKTISIKLKRFPDNEIFGLNILLQFAHNAALQASFHTISDDNFLKARDLSNGPVPLSFSYNLAGENIFDTIFDTPAYKYREIGFGAKIPIDKIDGIHALECEVPLPVFCAGEKFFNSYRLCRKRHFQEIKIGHGVSISICYEEKVKKFNYTPIGTLSEQIADIEFYHAVMDAQKLALGDFIINMPFSSLTPEEIQERKEKLEYFKTLQQAFLAAGHKGDVKVNDFTDEDWEKCQVLISAFINKKSRFTRPKDGVGFFCFTIGNVSLLLLISQNGDSSQVLNPYDAAIKTEMEGGDNKIPVSHFCFINEENLRQVSKFDFDAVMSSIKSVPLCKEYLEQLISLLLKMLRAYDAGANDPEMLSYCEKFATWLWEQNSNSLPCKINLYQVFKRQRALTAEEISDLHKIMESADTSNDLMAGIYILLSDWRNFSEHFDKLSKDLQDYFMSYPIFNLLPEKIRAVYKAAQPQKEC